MSTDDGETALTKLNHDDLDLIQPEHFRVVSDGHEIDAWVLIPPGDDPLPLLLNIHGGPASQYGFGFFDEFQVYAGAGYGVVACNPRGSSGRGSDFTRAVVGEGWEWSMSMTSEVLSKQQWIGFHGSTSTEWASWVVPTADS